MKYLMLFAIGTWLYTSNVSAQTTGFLGKRTMVSVSARLRTPLWFNYYSNSRQLSAQSMKFVDGTYEEASNLLDLGFNASATYALSRKVGVTANFAYETFKFHTGTNLLNDWMYWGKTGGNYSVTRATFLRGQFSYGSLGITFSSRDGLLPIGLTHEIGFGYGKASTKNSEENKFRLRQTFHSEGDTSFVEGEFINVDSEDLFDDQINYNLLVPYYKLKMVRPLTEDLLLSFGLQYSIHWVRTTTLNNNDNFILKPNDVSDGIKAKAFRNIVNFEIGLGYCF